MELRSFEKPYVTLLNSAKRAENQPLPYLWYPQISIFTAKCLISPTPYYSLRRTVAAPDSHPLDYYGLALPSTLAYFCGTFYRN